MYAADVLKKSVSPASDGVHYQRVIKGVGEVTKVLIGLPRGVPVTSSDDPQCPIPERVAGSRRRGGARRKPAVDRSNEAVFAHTLSLVAL